MTTATRIPNEMAGWPPVTRLYQVDDGYLAVTVLNFLTAKGTQVFYADESGGALSMQSLVDFPEGTDFATALQNLGYTVVDNVVEPRKRAPRKKTVKPEPSVFDILPDAIRERIQGAVNALEPDSRWIRSDDKL